MIYKLEDGVFFSKLVCNNGEKEYSIDSRTSDAVAIALRFGCPIYIDEGILEKRNYPIHPPKLISHLRKNWNQRSSKAQNTGLSLMRSSIK